ncbi:MAG: methylated-DNA--[protein]-cysteine S-methyltransferase [Proteobacteria bacterium]|nr:methylated-DNA--[protein]-cysteine S-methyltransferase [Pseudomonadota bacterium]
MPRKIGIGQLFLSPQRNTALLLSDMSLPPAEYDFLYDSPIGKLGVCIDSESITRIVWLEEKASELLKISEGNVSNDCLKKMVIEALDNYFNSGLFESEISLRPQGTPFQLKVWQALKTIPFGSVRTYGDVAKECHSSSRAVGQACRRNNIPLFIPCHRVVAAKGLGGFMGGYRHVERKRWLLQHEGIL